MCAASVFCVCVRGCNCAPCPPPPPFVNGALKQSVFLGVCSLFIVSAKRMDGRSGVDGRAKGGPGVRDLGLPFPSVHKEQGKQERDNESGRVIPPGVCRHDGDCEKRKEKERASALAPGLTNLRRGGGGVSSIAEPRSRLRRGAGYPEPCCRALLPYARSLAGVRSRPLLWAFPFAERVGGRDLFQFFFSGSIHGHPTNRRAALSLCPSLATTSVSRVDVGVPLLSVVVVILSLSRSSALCPTPRESDDHVVLSKDGH